MTTELTNTEVDRLRELESQIESNITMVGRALFEIRESRLYRLTHSTFEDYCQERFSMSRKYINKQIQAAEVIENLTPIGVTPKNEAQARPLAKLPAEQQPAAWEMAQEKAKGEGKPVAARHVEEAVSEIKNPKPIAAEYFASEDPESEEYLENQDREQIAEDAVKASKQTPVVVIPSSGQAIAATVISTMSRLHDSDLYFAECLESIIAYCQDRISKKH